MIRDNSHPSAEVIIAKMLTIPPGQDQLGRWPHMLLQELTAELIRATPGAAAEYKRFLDIRNRQLDIPAPNLEGARILVTGGTGCVGSILLRQLAAAGAGELISVSRGYTHRYPRSGEVAYIQADIRDSWHMHRLMQDLRPDVVFHVAAQRDPGMAAAEVHRTVTTNVLGTRNVLDAAAGAGVSRFVYASTGKALRPRSPEVYTASKKAAEYLCGVTARTTGMLVSAGRFTHVLDNSIIHQRLRAWAQDPEDTIRLHQPDIVFYVQSGCESAQLLISAGTRPGEFRIHAINDLGWPVSLLDVTLAMLGETGSKTPVYFSGYDQGYEETAPAGLYDPAISWNVSPLFSGREARNLVDSGCSGTDAFRYGAIGRLQAGAALTELSAVCEKTRDNQKIRQALSQVSGCLDCHNA